MHDGPEDPVKAHHAELSEQQPTTDTWADILRKTFIVAVVSIAVWAACALLRHVVGIGSEWLFHTANSFSSTHVLLGGAAILVVMTIAGTVRGLLLLIPAWKDAAGDGVEKALVSYHKTYKGDGELLGVTERIPAQPEAGLLQPGRCPEKAGKAGVALAANFHRAGRNKRTPRALFRHSPVHSGKEVSA